MANEETLSREEIIRLIEEGDRYAGIKFEEIKEDFKILVETYDTLDAKIDNVDAKLEKFREEANFKFSLLFEDNQRFFGELRAMRREFSERFDKLEAYISGLQKIG